MAPEGSREAWPNRPVVAGRGGPAGAALTRVERVALGIDPGRAAVGLGALIALFAVLGSLHRLGAPLALFDLDGEGKPPAVFSGALLLCAGVLAWAIGDTAAESAFRGRWRAIGTLFVFLGVDEMLTIHESLAEGAGVLWQLLYVPVGLVAAAIWIMVVWRLPRDGPERLFFICAPGLWLISQVLETIQNEPSDRVGGYGAMATAEELLEMIGSALFLLALLFALQRTTRRGAGAEGSG